MMNWDSFNILGYISVILWICVPVLWGAHKLIRPRRWLCHIALGLAVLAFACAKVNSLTHVNRIQLDRSEEMLAWEAKQEAARQAAKDSRGEDVAQIRFAEDGQGDFLDNAGMDEADLKYFEKLEQGSVPEWKKAKKQRVEGAAPDDSLEGLIGGSASSEGMTSDSLGEVEAAAPIMMLADELAMARRLDAANLLIIQMVIVLGLFLVIIDYLQRANVYEEAYAPLPLPSAWLHAATPIPPVFHRPTPPRRSMPEELSWLSRRGDSFLYLGEAPVSDGVLRITDDISDDFVFEALWYGRSSFVLDSADRAEHLLKRFTELLNERRATRARVSQTAHVVVDRALLGEAEDVLQPFAKQAAATGFTLFICQ